MFPRRLERGDRGSEREGMGGAPSHELDPASRAGEGACRQGSVSQGHACAGWLFGNPAVTINY